LGWKKGMAEKAVASLKTCTWGSQLWLSLIREFSTLSRERGKINHWKAIIVVGTRADCNQLEGHARYMCMIWSP